MKKEEFERILAGAGEAPDTGPIEAHLHALATEVQLPELAVALCTARYDDAAPALRALLARAAGGETLSENDARLLFRGLYIMGGARDAAAFPLLLRLLRRPFDEVEPLLGDTITEGLGKIATGMFDGDADGLLSTITDRSIDEFIRKALFDAATFLTWERRIDPDRLRGFLLRFYEERLAGDGDYGWIGWLYVISTLGYRDLAPLVHRAWDEGLVPGYVLSRKHFEDDLRDAERRPDHLPRLKEANLGYIDDALAALQQADGAGVLGEEPGDPAPGNRIRSPVAPVAPVINPWRNVGRNDPCLCGSGKKAKKCCLAS